MKTKRYLILIITSFLSVLILIAGTLVWTLYLHRNSSPGAVNWLILRDVKKLDNRIVEVEDIGGPPSAKRISIRLSAECSAEDAYIIADNVKNMFTQEKYLRRCSSLFRDFDFYNFTIDFTGLGSKRYFLNFKTDMAKYREGKFEDAVVDVEYDFPVEVQK